MAITSLSQHNAFEGKHSSVGERSMLGVFQEVAKALAERPVGGLATFDLMFEGIRSALKSSVQQSIQIAERNLDDDFAVRVLKALFLVKYVKEFKPTVRNISILLLSEFELDQAGQRRKIEDAWRASSARPTSSATARSTSSSQMRRRTSRLRSRRWRSILPRSPRRSRRSRRRDPPPPEDQAPCNRLRILFQPEAR